MTGSVFWLLLHFERFNSCLKEGTWLIGENRRDEPAVGNDLCRGKKNLSKTWRINVLH